MMADWSPQPAYTLAQEKSPTARFFDAFGTVGIPWNGWLTPMDWSGGSCWSIGKSLQGFSYLNQKNQSDGTVEVKW